MNILHIDSSPAGDKSFSRKFSAALVEKLKTQNPGATVIYRDLATTPLPHIDPDMLNALFAPADTHSAAQKEALARSDKAVQELLAADAVVIGAPMYNFSIPSALKAWVDHVIRKGLTFEYTAEGPRGLIPAGRKAFIIASRGGIYSEGATKAFEHQDSYLKAVLGFIGFTDITVIPVEGLAYGDEAVAKAVAGAEERVAKAA